VRVLLGIHTMITSQQTFFEAFECDLAGAPAFIERQFPVARISMESYKERTAKQSQTLTGLGKWWGRKPLVLVRAVILGLLMPASEDPFRDREIFLKLLTMDTEGLQRRKSKNIPGVRLIAEVRQMAPSIRRRFLSNDETALHSDLSREDKQELQRIAFDHMPYAARLEFCDRPEQIEGPSTAAWSEINAHLGTSAQNLPELADQLGMRRFGHTPRLGDAFCGGGSIPFEAARLGCEVYGSDLNPVAALLTWASLNIVGGGPQITAEVRQAQRRVFEAVDRQITAWGIEHNAEGWRADAYLYCIEVTDPESGWQIPLAPSWVIGEKTRTVAKLIPDPINKRYDIEIHQGVSDAEMAAARTTGTVKDYRLFPPDGSQSTPIEAISRSLRFWERDDITPRSDDVFRERLYAIRWVETIYGEDGNVVDTRRHYRTPTKADLQRENRVLELLRQQFDDWQERGYIPNRKIEPGKDINRPTNARGWTYWHHFFNPRQLLITGLFAHKADTLNLNAVERVGSILGIGRLADWNSRQSRWHSNAANEKGEQTFYKPSLSTPLANYCCRAFSALDIVFFLDLTAYDSPGNTLLTLGDTRLNNKESDIWLTDPPYADAVNYHELSEFFLAWYEKHLRKLFPEWYIDSKRALAVNNSAGDFRRAMMECYRNLAQNMPDEGFQVVMFTHQDTAVWADLTVILWASGLRVTSAWCISTETDSTLKQGNFVQGTVILILRKRTDNEIAFLDEISHNVEIEVRRQLDTMLALEDNSEPNFADADYQLAAYSAALRVLTVQPVDGIDPEREIMRERRRGEVGPVEKVIRNAVKIACDHLVPRGFDGELWKDLSGMERFYLKGLEVESHGEYRNGVYQELARGFGAAEYTDLLAGKKPTKHG
jgi:putative DNA methylase